MNAATLRHRTLPPSPSVKRRSYCIEGIADILERRFLGLTQEQDIEMLLPLKETGKYRSDFLHDVRARTMSRLETKRHA
jgi:hypothetical protein